jgi:cell wall-associated NlpC family hydrolase
MAAPSELVREPGNVLVHVVRLRPGEGGDEGDAKWHRSRSSLVSDVRGRIVAAARWGIRNEPRIHYARVRPIPLTRALPLTTDCSGFATLCYYLAGAPDPNGRDYDGTGWTGTLLEAMENIDRRAVLAGDLVVWGEYPGHHCAVVLRPGDDPLLASHGQERGPLAIRFSDESRYQPAEVTWLSVLP